MSEDDIPRRRFTTDDQATLLRWAAARIPGQRDWVADAQAIGVLDRTDKVIAVGVLNMFHDDGAWAHFAADRKERWADREVIGSMFYFSFIHCKLRRITARVAVSNIPSQKVCLQAGFTIEGRERKALNGEDVILFGMLAEECMWIKEA